jgi:hypothetical protein
MLDALYPLILVSLHSIVLSLVGEMILAPTVFQYLIV